MAKFDKQDWALIAENIVDQHRKRKNDPERKHLQKVWKDIDRQIKMKAASHHKMTADGKVDRNKAWMPECELPNQAETLEVLTSDGRRLMFPDYTKWFRAHACLTDDYLKRVDFQSLVSGDDKEVPSVINQDDADRLVESVVMHWQRQYDFYGHMDLINGESFKYGVGIGRVRLADKRIFQSRTGYKSRKIPILVPGTIKNTYLPDDDISIMAQGFVLSPAIITDGKMKLEDLKLAAEKGSNDPNDINGGWMPAMLKGVEGDDKGMVEVVEWEGDLVVPRKTVKSIYVPNTICTVVISSGKDQSVARVVRCRINKYSFSPTIVFPYHREDVESPYGGSPLMKGHPIQLATVDILNRLMEASALNTQPPIGYDREDMWFAQEGGPLIFPGVQWGTIGDIKVHEIGDPSGLFNVYLGFLKQYSDVTGITAPRLGAQSVSHTTAYAKQVEMSQGESRTVDYVKSTLSNPLFRYLNAAWQIGRDNFESTSLFMDEYNGWVDLKKDHLPDEVAFEPVGVDEPAEDAQIKSTQTQALMGAIQIEELRMKTMGPNFQPLIDFGKVQEQLLRLGGITDVAAFGPGQLNGPGAGISQPAAPGPGMAIAPIQAAAAPSPAIPGSTV